MKIELVVLTTGEIRRELHEWILSLLGSRRYDIVYRDAYDQPIASNRNRIAKRFRAGDADYLLMIDDDQVITTDILSLAELDLDVVGCPSPVFKLSNPPDRPISWNVWQEDETGRRIDGSLGVGSGVLEVAGIGTGAMMIARRVLEHPAMAAPFMDEFDADGVRVRGEDALFCHRARGCGFKVWAAMDHIVGHAKIVNLLTMLKAIEYHRGQASGPFTPPAVAFEDKMLVFCVSPGRCGTQWLAEALDTIDGVTARHEPEPAFHHVLKEAQHDPGEATRFWLERKLPQIALEDDPIYVETSHLFCEGFAEALLAVGIMPRVLVIRRPHREVALSMWRRGAIPGRTQLGRDYHVQPDDPGVLCTEDETYNLGMRSWHDWTDYQVCYWYCLEIEARAKRLADRLAKYGGLVIETTTAEMATPAGLMDVCEALGLGHANGFPGPRNGTPQRLANKCPSENLDKSERDVKSALLNGGNNG